MYVRSVNECNRMKIITRGRGEENVACKKARKWNRNMYVSVCGHRTRDDLENLSVRRDIRDKLILADIRNY